MFQYYGKSGFCSLYSCDRSFDQHILFQILVLQCRMYKTAISKLNCNKINTTWAPLQVYWFYSNRKKAQHSAGAAWFRILEPESISFSNFIQFCVNHHCEVLTVVTLSYPGDPHVFCSFAEERSSQEKRTLTVVKKIRTAHLFQHSPTLQRNT